MESHLTFNIGVVHEDGVIEEDLEIPDDPPVIRNTSLHFTEDPDTQDTEDRRTQSPQSVQVLNNVLFMVAILQGYPQRMRLYGICSLLFQSMIPCN